MGGVGDGGDPPTVASRAPMASVSPPPPAGNYNNNSLDDNELSDPEYPWKIQDTSEAG